MSGKNLHELNPRKRVHNGFVIYFLSQKQLKLLKTRYKEVPWKFPELTFKDRYVKYKYIEDSFLTKLKTIMTMFRIFITGKCFLDDVFPNIKGKLIDFDDLDYVSRKLWLLHVFEFKCIERILHKLFNKQYYEMYTANKIILHKDPLVIMLPDEYIKVLDDYNDDSVYNIRTKEKIEGKYKDLLNEYISRYRLQ